MQTEGITTTAQIDAYYCANGGFLKTKDSINKELNLKSMLISCFTYGGISRNSYNFETYIAKHQKEMSTKLFDSIYNEMNDYFSKCEIIDCVYTDAEGCSYNSIIEKK